MKSQLVLAGLLSVSLVYPLSAQAGGHPGGGGGGHVAAPAPQAAPAPHVSAPQAHFAEPRAMPQSHFEAPRAIPQAHFQAPHAMPQAHFEAPHATPQAHFEASHATPQGHFESAHAMPLGHFENAHALPGGAPHSEARGFQSPEAERGAFNKAHMAGRVGPGRQEAGFEAGRGGVERGLPCAERNVSRGEFPGENRVHMNEGARSIANAARFGGPENRAENFAGRNRALGVAGGVAAGGLAAAALAHAGHNELGGRNEVGAGHIPGPPAFANPRHSLAPEVGRAMPLSAHAAPNLSYRADAHDIPRIGDARVGRAGPMDPGGYIREGRFASANINPAFARQQLALANANYMQAAAFNARNIVGNRGAWPWQLPNYSPPWFGGWQGNWNWSPNWYSGGWGPGWGPSWGNGGGFFGFLSALSPWGCNSDLGWIPSLNYYNSYGWDGQNYPCDYYAANGFCPTPYVFNVNNGQFWNVGNGYSDYLPADYHAPITVAVQESVPVYAPNGQILSYQLQNFYYNAYWDPQAQNYGYYDYKQQFHWLTFPWDSAWNGGL